MTTKKIGSADVTRCELALMGIVVTTDDSTVQAMTEYICQVLKKPIVNVLESIKRYNDNKVKYLVVNRVMGMPCITYLLENGEEYPKPFEEDYGSGFPSAFCYVLNIADPECSEFGDCFFKHQPNGWHRVS